MEEPMTQIAGLRPFQKRVQALVRVLKKNPVREVTSKLDNTQHSVTEATVGDSTGTVLLTLWDQDIEKLEDNKTYLISNGYTSLFKNNLRLNIGRYGKAETSDQDVGTVNEENNVSEKQFDA